jgi:hypothetical protein
MSDHCGTDCTSFEWGEYEGIDGPVLLCTSHRQPGTGDVYDREASNG